MLTKIKIWLKQISCVHCYKLETKTIIPSVLKKMRELGISSFKGIVTVDVYDTHISTFICTKYNKVKVVELKQ